MSWAASSARRKSPPEQPAIVATLALGSRYSGVLVVLEPGAYRIGGVDLTARQVYELDDRGELVWLFPGPQWQLHCLVHAQGPATLAAPGRVIPWNGGSSLIRARSQLSAGDPEASLTELERAVEQARQGGDVTAARDIVDVCCRLIDRLHPGSLDRCEAVLDAAVGIIASQAVRV